MVQLEDTIYKEIVKTRQAQTEKIALLEAEVQWYKEQLGLAKKRLYGPSSEKTPVGQEAMLFNEAEACASAVLPDPETETITYNRRKKVTGKREAQLADLPVEDIFYELSEEAQVCPQCSGPLHEMGHDVRQEIEVIPAKVVLVKHRAAKYALSPVK
jgi:transposase